MLAVDNKFLVKGELNLHLDPIFTLFLIPTL